MRVSSRLGGSVIGVLLLSAGSVAIVTAQGAPSGAPPQSGLELFSAMLPAYQSPRCVNCHGIVNPETGENHPGGKIDGAKAGGFDNTGGALCASCHTEHATGAVTAHDETHLTQARQNFLLGLGGSDWPADMPKTEIVHVPAQKAAGPWRLAPAAMSFVGKDATTLCRETRALSGDGSGDANGILVHLTGDTRIAEAFEGFKGMDARSDFYNAVAEPPPMSQSEFEQAAGDWVVNAGASCAGPGWHGTLKYEQTTHDLITHDSAGPPAQSQTIEQKTFTSQIWQVMPKPNPDDGLTSDWSATSTGSADQKDELHGDTVCSRGQHVPYGHLSTVNTTMSGDVRARLDVIVQDLGNNLFYIQTVPSADVHYGQMVARSHSESTGGCGPFPPTNDTQTNPYPIPIGLVEAQATATQDGETLTLQGAQTSATPDGRLSITISWNLTNP